jgi:Na+-transporting NADH:ubiquinone oxidoreductase subunit C
MAKKIDGNTYTLVFAAGMVVVVGAVLAFLASSLSPSISENKRIEKQQNILYAMGINENDKTSVKFVSKEKVAETFDQYISKQLVIEGGEIKEDNEAYLIDLKKENSREKNGEIRRLPLFIGEKNKGEKIYIVPVRGKGLWDAIWGYVAVDKNMVVEGVFFDHAAETPGLGANIKERFFMDDFKGEYLLSKGIFKGIKVKKGNADPKNLDKYDHEVDAIAGSTITGDGLAAMLKKDIKRYLPHLKKLNESWD